MDLGTLLGFAVGVISIFGVACGWDLLPYFVVPAVGIVFGGCITCSTLAHFHEALALFYERALRNDPAPEDKEEQRRHVDRAMAALKEIVDTTPPESSENKEAKKMLSTFVRRPCISR